MQPVPRTWFTTLNFAGTICAHCKTGSPGSECHRSDAPSPTSSRTSTRSSAYCTAWPAGPGRRCPPRSRPASAPPRSCSKSTPARCWEARPRDAAPAKSPRRASRPGRRSTAGARRHRQATGRLADPARSARGSRSGLAAPRSRAAPDSAGTALACVPRDRTPAGQVQFCPVVCSSPTPFASDIARAGRARRGTNATPIPILTGGADEWSARPDVRCRNRMRQAPALGGSPDAFMAARVCA